MKKTLLTIAIALSGYCSHAQTDVGEDITAIGLGATSTSSNYKFNYNGKSVGHYGLGWYDDVDFTGGPMAYLGGYGGIKFFTAGSPRLDINNNGNIGIGTTSPNYPLQVNGNVAWGVTGNNYMYGYGATQRFAYTGNNSNVLYSGGSDGLGINNQADNVRLVQITDAGNVGIGTITPDTKLAVNGTIHSKEVKVDLIGWPDYVFKPKYTLLSLTEVKSYIDKNQHLPDMPSEVEVKQNGINLGEMNKLLTKKVEELTLYLIEKDSKDKEKEIKLQSQDDQLKQQNVRIAVLEAALSKLTTTK